MVQEAKTKTEEYVQLLSGAVSTVYAVEGEASTLQQTIVMHREEITQFTRSNEEMKESWNHMTTTNSALRAQLYLVESTFTSEQRDASARLHGLLFTRDSLEAGLAGNGEPNPIGDPLISE